MPKTRKITVTTRGPIRAKSGIVGPLRVPYLEDVRVIARMLIEKVGVTEHFEDGSTKVLSLKDVPALTADSGKVLAPNPIQRAEANKIQAEIDKQKKALAAKAPVVEEAPKAPVKEEVVVAPVEPAKEEEVDLSKMTKKERQRYIKEQEAKATADANERVEDIIE